MAAPPDGRVELVMEGEEREKAWVDQDVGQHMAGYVKNVERRQRRLRGV